MQGRTIEQEDLPTVLDELDADELDELSFGVVRMDRAGRVVAYNRAEAELSGLEPENVTGEDFFVQVAPCTNNFLVAQRYADEDALDELIDYVFTYRMVPTEVRIRMIKRPESPYQYLLVEGS